MKTRFSFLVPLFILLPIFSFTAYAQPVLTLKEVLERAENQSADIQAQKFRQHATEESISTSKASYFPSLELDAIDSTGFPGSTGVLGIGGLAGSPYRSGPAVGAVLRATLWDFGRTSSGVSAAKNEFEAERYRSWATRFSIDNNGSRIFYECVKNKSLSDTWEFVLKEAQIIAGEVHHFVKTGQRSVVENYLADSQVEEAVTSKNNYEIRLQSTKKELALLTGLDSQTINCPSGVELTESDRILQGKGIHPIVATATKVAAAASDRKSQIKADFFPKIVGTASIGLLSKSRLVPKDDYAVGIGLVVPLFDGLKTSAELEKASATVSEKEALIREAQYQVDQTNEHFNAIIDSSKERLVHLQNESKLAQEGFSLAKKRYFASQGTLVDLREALRNLTRTKTQINETQNEYIQSSITKALFNQEKP